MAGSFTPSAKAYRQRLARLTSQVQDGPEFVEGMTKQEIATAVAVFRGRISALNAITKAAAVDRQLEDLATLHKTILELRAKILELTTAHADERHNSAARIDSDGDAESSSG